MSKEIDFDIAAPEPFERIRLSQSYIRQYKESKNRELLSSANAEVDLALKRDPDFIVGHYYKGIIQDLLGKAKDAVVSFETVMTHNPEVMADAEYNLGVAHYHCYSRDNLENAEQHFLAVIRRTQSRKKKALNLLARAGLAQTYAMLMVPSLRGLTAEQIGKLLESEAPKNDAAAYYEKSKEEADRVVSELSKHRGIENVIDEISWIIHNTRAISEMFYTDFLEDDRIARLEKGLRELDEANGHSPDNWSIYCNYGSTHMRMGHWIAVETAAADPTDVVSQRSAKHFGEALRCLQRVVDDLRPKYGFALYEIGRVHRLRGAFSEAIKFFAKAKTIKHDRDVGDERLNLETARAKKHSTVFP